MKTVYLSFLGKFQCRYQDSPITTFRSDKIRALLVYLAVEADTPHRREALAALFWPDHTHAIALRNLRKSLHRLRQTLDAAAPELSTAVLTITRQTVQLHKTAVSIDTHTFEHALTHIENHAHHSLAACADCLTLLNEATDLYQGDLLAGLSLPDAVLFEEWLLVKREFLHQKALTALHTLAAAYERRGDYEQAYAVALRQTALEPWREEAHRQLMRALARQGERSRALAQYEVCRDLLMDELGVSPSLKTAVLYDKIKQGTFSDVTEQTAVSIHHFPTQFTTFVGRDEEITAVSDHLLNPDCRLLTIIGAGGMGKTRLSVQAVHHIIKNHAHAIQTHFADGCYFVPLVDADDREQLITAIAKALHITFQAMGDPEQQLFSYLKGKKLLLVLDNFEQLVRETPAQSHVETAVFISHLLQAAPAVQLLISSREALNTQAEWRLCLDGLSYPDATMTDVDALADVTTYGAVRLFVQTAHRVQPAFKPNETDLAAIVHICQLTQGVPLALEIAAAWVRMMDCKAIASQIMQNFGFLKTTLRDTPDRHRSMRVVFEQSWGYLSPAEQSILAQLSIFHGGFQLEAALAVMDDAMTELSGLLDKSLLRRGGNGRYTLHELLRQFAAKKLAASDEAMVHGALRRHSTYYLNLIAGHKDMFSESKTAVSWDVAQTEIDNIRQAWAWAVANGQWNSIAEAVDGLSLFYQSQGLLQEGMVAFQTAVSTLEMESEEVDGEIINQLRLHQTHILLAQFDYAKALELAQITAQSCQKSGSKQQFCLALAELGIAHWRLDDYPAAKARLDESLTLARKLSLPYQTAYALHHLGNITIMQKEPSKARPLYTEAITLYEKIGDLRDLANVFNDYTILAAYENDFEMAEIYCRRSMELHNKIHNPMGAVLPLSNLCYLTILNGNYEAATQYGEEALRFVKVYGIEEGNAGRFNNMGHSYMLKGEFTTAVYWYKQSVMAVMDAHDKRDLLMGLTAVVATVGDKKIALQLLPHKDEVDDPLELKLYEQAASDIRAGLTDAEWETAVSIGSTLTLDQAISLALAHAEHTPL